jgi:hypothetical protein
MSLERTAPAARRRALNHYRNEKTRRNVEKGVRPTAQTQKTQRKHAERLTTEDTEIAQRAKRRR